MLLVDLLFFWFQRGFLFTARSVGAYCSNKNINAAYLLHTLRTNNFFFWVFSPSKAAMAADVQRCRCLLVSVIFQVFFEFEKRGEKKYVPLYRELAAECFTNCFFFFFSALRSSGLVLLFGKKKRCGISYFNSVLYFSNGPHGLEQHFHYIFKDVRK